MLKNTNKAKNTRINFDLITDYYISNISQYIFPTLCNTLIAKTQSIRHAV